MAEEWGVDIRQLAAKIKNFILNAVQDGEIIQTKGKWGTFLMIIKDSYSPWAADLDPQLILEHWRVQIWKKVSIGSESASD